MHQPKPAREATVGQFRRATAGSRLRRGERDGGQALVELALVLPLLLLMLVGVIDVGRLVYTTANVTNAARAGAMYGSLTSALDSPGMILAAQNEVNAAPTLSSVTGVRVCRCSGADQEVLCTTICPNGQQLITYAKVTASAAYSPLFPYPGVPGNSTLTKTVSMRVGQ